MIDFATALSAVRKDLTAGDVHMDTAMGSPPKKPKRGVDKADGYVPPEGAQAAARRALEVRASKPASERGMTPVGLARARDISGGKALSLETVKRMVSFFARHAVDRKGSTWDEQGKGWQAFMGWGGAAGEKWANSIVSRVDKGFFVSLAEDMASGGVSKSHLGAAVETWLRELG